MTAVELNAGKFNYIIHYFMKKISLLFLGLSVVTLFGAGCITIGA